MARFQVSCPSCQAQYQVEDSLLGRKGRCKHCKTSFVLTPADAAAATWSSPWPWASKESSDRAHSAITAPSAGRPPSAPDGVPPTWKPGDAILDLYEVLEVFTSGGMGLVYRVRHRGWNVDLAVKCPRPEYFRNEQDKENFEQEAETWVKLGLHPYTVVCHYVRRLGGIPRVFAEYVAGGSLSEWIRTKKLYRGGPDKARERILDVAIQFAWGLQHAHDQGLVHRDVKSGNVLLTTAGIAKVTDFGMAKARGATGEPAGGHGPRSILVSAGGMTPAFCSPEQVLGQPVSRRTDIWSWGVSVLEMFTGGATWSAGHLAAGALADYRKRGPAEEHLPAMPPALAELLQSCFQRDADDRPQDMLELVAVLHQVYQEAAGHAYAREAPQPAEALADSLNNRAVSLLDLNKQHEGEQLWQEALAAGPNHPESTYNLGLVQWRDGRLSTQTLLQKLQEVCATHPGEWLPFYLLAQVFLEQGKWPAAIEILEGIAAASGGAEEVRAALALARDCVASSRYFVRSFEGHTDWVSSVCISADGRYALSGSADRILRLWDSQTGQCLGSFQGHTEWVTSVCLNADGRFALSGSADQTLRLWQVATGCCLRTLTGHTKWVLAVSLSADGRYALSGGGDNLVKLWDLATGKCLANLEGHAAPVLSVALSADGRFALSGSRDATLKLWDVAGGECLRTFLGHGDKVLSVCLSGDGQRALSGSGDKTIKLWHVPTGHCLRTLEGHASSVNSVALSADGRYALSGSSDRTAKLWRLAQGRCLHTLEGHAGTVNSVCLGADGRHALSGSGDKTLTLWSLPCDVVAPYLVSRVLTSETVLAARLNYEQALARSWQALSSGDAVSAARAIREARAQPGYGRRPEAVNQWSGLYVRLARTALNGGWEGNTFEGHRGPVTSVSVGGNNRFLLSGSADWLVKLWEIATGHCLHTFEGHASAVLSICLSRDGRLALSGSADRTLRLWETARGRCLATFEGHLDAVSAATLSADGRLALSGSADRTLKLWETAGGRCLRTLEGHTDPIHSVCLSADGRYALSAGAQYLIRNESERLFTSGQLKLWDLATGRCLPSFEAQAEAVTALCLSSDGRQALTGSGPAVNLSSTERSARAGQVHLWELRTGRCLSSFAGHGGTVTSVCLSAEGRFALSGSTDRTLRLWKTDTGECVRSFEGHADAVTSVSLSTDARFAVSGSADRTIKLWILDWELADNQPVDWDDGASPYLEVFLTLHTPYAAPLPQDRKRSVKEIVNLPIGRLFRSTPTEEEITQALTRRGKPVWTEEDFEHLLYTLGCAGYGWLRPEGVQRKLKQLARKWTPPALSPE